MSDTTLERRTKERYCERFIMRQDIEKTTLNAFIWDYIGKFASHVISFIITIILTKLVLQRILV